MTKLTTATLEWCIIRLGEDMNWWVDEVSDPIRWDVDGLSIIDPRQINHLIDLVDPLRDYGFDQDIMDAAFIPFRIECEVGGNRVRLKRVKDSLFDTEEMLFGLPDVLDEENGPYADLLNHITRCRVKMLNSAFNFESKLTVDEVEDEIREEQNTSFIEGRAIHVFDELTAILDFVPAGWDLDNEDEEGAATADDEEDPDIDDEDLPEIDDEEEERLNKDESLRWDDDEEGDDEELAEGEGEEEEDDEEEEEEAPAPKKRRR